MHTRFREEPFILIILLSICLQTSSHIQGDPIPLPSPTMLLYNSPSASTGARHSPAEQHCKTSSGMKTSSIYRVLRLGESFQRAFWKGSHLAALKACKGKRACTLLHSFGQHSVNLCSKIHCALDNYLMLYTGIYEALKKFSSQHASSIPGLQMQNQKLEADSRT